MKSGVRVMTLQCSGFGNRIGHAYDWTKTNVYVEFPHPLKTCKFQRHELVELPLTMTRERWADMTEAAQRAYVQEKNKRISCTTDIADNINYGFGEEDGHGFFEFPCPWYKPTPSPESTPHG